VATASFTGWLSDPFTFLTTGDVVLSVSGGGHGAGGGLGQHGSGESVPGGVVGVILAYGSIAAIPAALTVLVDTVAKRRRRPQMALQRA